MLSNSKRKSRWSSKGFFGSKATNKVVVIERSSSNNRNENGVDSLGSSSNGRPEKTGIRSRFRHSGSKVLSFLGLSKQSGKSMFAVAVFSADSESQAAEDHRHPPMAPRSAKLQLQSPEMPRSYQRAQSVSVALSSAALRVFLLLELRGMEHLTQPLVLRYRKALVQAMRKTRRRSPVVQLFAT